MQSSVVSMLPVAYCLPSYPSLRLLGPLACSIDGRSVTARLAGDLYAAQNSGAGDRPKICARYRTTGAGLGIMLS
jgi:hypothetical protein